MNARDSLYEAARKALLGVLVNQGLQPTAKGGDAALYKAVYVQVTPDQQKILKPFERLRAWREAGIDTAVTAEDVRDVRAIIDLAEQLLDELPVYESPQEGA